jgi:hypothetical protein
MKPAHKSMKDAPITVTVSDEGEIRCDWVGQSIITRAVDGRFPDYRRVIPEKLDGQPAWINPDYLTRIVDAAKDVGAGFTFGFGGNSCSMAQIGSDMVAVVMPMRNDLTTDAFIAAWAKDALPVPAENAPKTVQDAPEAVETV